MLAIDVYRIPTVMVSIVVAHPDGKVRMIQVPPGRSLVAGMIAHHVGGLVAECGGTGVCGTCHVEVEWTEGCEPPMPADEVELLVALPESVVTASTRMACRVDATPAMEGTVVPIPVSRR